MKCNIDYDGLKIFLESLSYKDIREGALLKAIAMNDIEFFNMDKSKITLDRLIDYGDPFLVDIIGNDLSVCILSRKKYKTPTGRVVKAKFDRTIIHDCRKTFGSPVNEYYVIPERFISKK